MTLLTPAVNLNGSIDAMLSFSHRDEREMGTTNLALKAIFDYTEFQKILDNYIFFEPLKIELFTLYQYIADNIQNITLSTAVQQKILKKTAALDREIIKIQQARAADNINRFLESSPPSIEKSDWYQRLTVGFCSDEKVKFALNEEALAMLFFQDLAYYLDQDLFSDAIDLLDKNAQKYTDTAPLLQHIFNFAIKRHCYLDAVKLLPRFSNLRPHDILVYYKAFILSDISRGEFDTAKSLFDQISCERIGLSEEELDGAKKALDQACYLIWLKTDFDTAAV